MLFTPGLDSYLSDHGFSFTKHGVTRVYLDTNCRYSLNEVRILRDLYPKDYVEIIDDLDLRDIEHDDLYVPNRNLLFVSLVQGIYDADFIWLNGVSDDRVSDNNIEFYKLASDVLTKTAGKPVTVSSSLIEYEKSQCCNLYYKAMADNLPLLKNTFSCFDSNIALKTENKVYSYWASEDVFSCTKPTVAYYGCRSCTACYRKYAALTSANIYVEFLNKQLVYDYVNKIDPAQYPNRYKSAVEYARFNKLFEEDSIYAK